MAAQQGFAFLWFFGWLLSWLFGTQSADEGPEEQPEPEQDDEQQEMCLDRSGMTFLGQTTSRPAVVRSHSHCLPDCIPRDVH